MKRKIITPVVVVAVLAGMFYLIILLERMMLPWARAISVQRA